MPVILVTRNCCLSTFGKCVSCECGKRVRVCQYIATDMATAQRVKKNWHEYKSEIEEPTEEVISTLESRSQNWVREAITRMAIL